MPENPPVERVIETLADAQRLSLERQEPTYIYQTPEGLLCIEADPTHPRTINCKLLGWYDRGTLVRPPKEWR